MGAFVYNFSMAMLFFWLISALRKREEPYNKLYAA